MTCSVYLRVEKSPAVLPCPYVVPNQKRFESNEQKAWFKANTV